MATRIRDLGVSVGRGDSIPLKEWGARLFGLGIVLALWMLAGIRLPEHVLPTPIATVQLVVDLLMTSSTYSHLWDTVSRVIVAFVGAFVLGGVIGTLIGLNNYGRRFFTPYMVAGLAIPGIAWAAVFTISIGIGFTAPVLAGIVTTFPYVAINVWKGVEDIEHDLVIMSEAFDVPRLVLFKRMILRNIAPSLFSSFRFGFSISWKVVTTAEIFASTSGLGFKIIQTYSQYQYDSTWAWASLFVILVVLVEYGILRPLEKKAFAYRPDADFSRI